MEPIANESETKQFLSNEIEFIIESFDANRFKSIKDAIALIKNSHPQISEWLNQLFLAKLDHLSGNFDAAFFHFQSAIGIAKKIDSDRLLFETDLAYSRTEWKKGHTTSALKRIRSCCKYFSDIKNCQKTIQCLVLIGHISRESGRWKKAISYYNKVIAMSSTTKYDLGTAEGMNGLGIVYRIESEHKKAINCFVKSLDSYQKAGSDYGKAIVLNNLGNIYYHKSEFDKCLDHYLRSLSILRSVNASRDIAISLSNIGNVYFSIDKYDLALQYATEALDLKKKMSDEVSFAYSIASLGKIYEAVGKTEFALESYNRALSLFNSTSDRFNTALTLCDLGNVYRSMGDFEKAVEMHQNGLNLYEEIESKLGLSIVYPLLGWDYYHNNELPKSEDYFTKAYEYAKKIDDKHGVSSNSLALAYVKMAGDSSEDSIKLFNDAIDIANEINSPSEAQDAYKGLSKLYETKGQYKEALESYKLYISFRDQIRNDKAASRLSMIEPGLPTVVFETPTDS